MSEKIQQSNFALASSQGKSLSFRWIIAIGLLSDSPCFLARGQIVKYFFYTVMFVGSLGTAGAVMNPALVQRGAAFIGLELPQRSTDSEESVSEEDQLSQFLAQYPFAHNQNQAEIVPASPVPMAMPPELPPEPAPVVPIYAAQPEPASWDGENVMPIASPIYEAPAAENFSPAPEPNTIDWSGPAQPYQEPPPPPKQSVYDVLPQNPPQESFPPNNAAMNNPPAGNASSVGFAPTNYVPQQTSPPVQEPMQEMQPIPATPIEAAAIEDVPMHGTEMVARVGRQVILMGDILPKLRRAAQKVLDENFKHMTPEDRSKVTQEEIELVTNTFIEKQYPGFLQEQIHAALVYNDFDVSKSKAEKDYFFENLGNEFDRNEVPAMIKEFNVENAAALKQYLSEQLGSSLERERRLWIQEQIVRQWIGLSVQRATGECTHDEMMEYYEANIAAFTTPARARWQEMQVIFSNYGSEQEAMEKIRWMGNQVAGGAPFEEITKANSDGFTKDKGGVWDWTAKGSLTSAVLEQAIFTQPLGHLSPAIIRSDRGLHIIKVLERHEVHVVPFVEAQVTIREKIRSQRIQRHQEEYFADLRRRFPMVVLKEQIDFNAGNPRTAQAVL